VSNHTAWEPAAARDIILAANQGAGALLPILHALQETFGYIDREAEPLIADVLNLTRAEIHGVVSFYHDFRSSPPARHVLKLCRAEACQSMGAERLAERAKARLGLEFGQSSRERGVALEPVYCLGLCATAPSAMLDGRLVGRLNDEKLDSLLQEAER